VTCNPKETIHTTHHACGIDFEVLAATIASVRLLGMPQNKLRSNKPKCKQDVLFYIVYVPALHSNGGPVQMLFRINIGHLINAATSKVNLHAQRPKLTSERGSKVGWQDTTLQLGSSYGEPLPAASTFNRIVRSYAVEDAN
jgi:hypothetical protein